VTKDLFDNEQQIFYTVQPIQIKLLGNNAAARPQNYVLGGALSIVYADLKSTTLPKQIIDVPNSPNYKIVFMKKIFADQIKEIASNEIHATKALMYTELLNKFMTLMNEYETDKDLKPF